MKRVWSILFLISLFLLTACDNEALEIHFDDREFELTNDSNDSYTFTSTDQQILHIKFNGSETTVNYQNKTYILNGDDEHYTVIYPDDAGSIECGTQSCAGNVINYFDYVNSRDFEEILNFKLRVTNVNIKQIPMIVFFSITILIIGAIYAIFPEFFPNIKREYTHKNRLDRYDYPSFTILKLRLLGLFIIIFSVFIFFFLLLI